MRTFLSAFLMGAAFWLNAQTSVFSNQGSTWAVVIGISDYQDNDISDLQYADVDAKAFYDFLRSPAGGNVPADHIQLLTNKDATNAHVANAMDWLMGTAKEGDRAVIYFSGHGDAETKTYANLGFFLTYDSSPQNYMAGAYPLFYLQTVISTLSQRNKSSVIMIADACRAGKLAGMSINGPQATTQFLQQQFAKEVKILGCGPTEYSVEGKQWGGGHGAFSYHLLQGLDGLADSDGNYEVDLFELQRYLDDHVPQETAPNSQYPLTFGDRKAALSWVDPNELKELKAEKAIESPIIAMVDTKGFGESLITPEDSLARRWYQGFQAALNKKQLLQPQDSSAYHYFQLLSEQRKEMTTLLGSMRRNLATALQDNAQQAINAYLKTTPDEMARRWHGNAPYRQFPEYLAKAIELLGTNHYMYKTLKAKELYFEALVLRMDAEEKNSSELMQQALQKLQEALQYEDKGAFLYNELGLIQGGLEQSEPEIAAYEKALELSPTWAMPANNLGVVYMKQKDWDKALEWCKKTIQLKPDLAVGYYNLGTVYMKMGKNEEAKLNLRKAIELDPNLDIAYHNLGSILYAEEKYADAEPVLQQLIKVNPKFTDGYYLLASTYLTTERYPLAEKMYQQALQLNPEHPYIHFGLGSTYENLGKLDKAIAEYQKNLEITPAWTYPNYAISVVYAKKGQQEQALSWLEKSLQLGIVDFKELEKESAFEKIRQTDAYKQLIAKYFPKNE